MDRPASIQSEDYRRSDGPQSVSRGCSQASKAYMSPLRVLPGGDRKLCKKGYRIVEVPINYRARMTNEGKKIRGTDYEKVSAASRLTIGPRNRQCSIVIESRRLKCDRG